MVAMESDPAILFPANNSSPRLVSSRVNALLRSVCPALLCGALASTAFAQAERFRTTARAILYADADYQGDAIILYPGDRIEDFARQAFNNGQSANDRISSIQLEGRMELILHIDANFRGDALKLTDSVANLADVSGPSRRGNWNDCISSAAAAAAEPRRPRWPGGTGRGEMRGPRVELYADANYRGSRLVLAPGDRVTNLADVGFEDGNEANDRISSIRVFDGAALVVYYDADFRGASLTVNESIPNLAFRNEGVGRRSWNDVISSIAVTDRRALTNADEVVTRRYRELLGRDPDPASLAHYAGAMRSRGFTESELQNEIRRSREFREQEADAAVRRAYREILRRDPDPEGLATYVRLMVEQAWSESRVRDVLRNSGEYRQQQS